MPSDPRTTIVIEHKMFIIDLLIKPCIIHQQFCSLHIGVSRSPLSCVLPYRSPFNLMSARFLRNNIACKTLDN